MFALYHSDRQTENELRRHADGEERRLVERPYREQDAGAPDKREQVEGAELARLVELAVFGLGEVLLPVDFLQRRTPVNNRALVLVADSACVCVCVRHLHPTRTPG